MIFISSVHSMIQIIVWHNILISYHFFYNGTTASFIREKDYSKYRYARDYLVWTIWNGDPMHEVCIPHRIPIAHRNSKDEARGRCSHQFYTKRRVRNESGQIEGKSQKSPNSC